MITPLRFHSNTIPAAPSGGVSAPVRIEISDADFFRFLNIPEGVLISVNDGTDLPLWVIPSFQRDAKDEPISVITLKNTKPTPIIYRMVSGRGILPPAFDNVVKEPPTRVVGVAGTIGANASIDLDPDLVLGARDQRRKGILVSNKEVSGRLELRTVAADPATAFLTIEPETSITVDVSSQCFLVNPDAAPKQYNLGHIIFTL